jgi:hypothetical protein
LYFLWKAAAEAVHQMMQPHAMLVVIVMTGSPLH